MVAQNMHYALSSTIEGITNNCCQFKNQHHQDLQASLFVQEARAHCRHTVQSHMANQRKTRHKACANKTRYMYYKIFILLPKNMHGMRSLWAMMLSMQGQSINKTGAGWQDAAVAIVAACATNTCALLFMG
jgi:hypothetical protein